MLVGKNTSSSPIYHIIPPPSSPPILLTPVHDARFCYSQLHLCFFFSFFHSGPFFCSETASAVMDGWFVYQNIDLFSLYTSTCSTLGPFLLTPPPFFFFSSPVHLWWTVLILTSTYQWSRRWQRELQERGWAVFIWGLLRLIGSVGLCAGEYLSDWSLSNW